MEEVVGVGERYLTAVVGPGRTLFVGGVGASVPWSVKACEGYDVGFDMVMYD